jgi:hypothetical protein
MIQDSLKLNLPSEWTPRFIINLIHQTSPAPVPEEMSKFRGQRGAQTEQDHTYASSISRAVLPPRRRVSGGGACRRLYLYLDLTTTAGSPSQAAGGLHSLPSS